MPQSGSLPTAVLMTFQNKKNQIGGERLRTRNVDIHIMLNQEEGQRFDDLCKRSGLSHAGLIRKMVLKCPIQERPNADFLSLTDAIDKIGINFNQLVRKVNTTGNVSNGDLKEAKRTYQQVLRLMHEWEKTWR